MADVDRTVASSVTISQFVAVLRQRWHVIAAIVALCLLAAGGLLSSTPPTYSARAVVRVNPLPGTADKDISTITESRIATSTSVARRVRTLLRTDLTPAQLVSHVAVSSPLDSQVLAFEYSASSARKAAAGANAFAEAYLAYRRDAKQDELDTQDARISQRIGQVSRLLTELDQKLRAAGLDADQRAAVGDERIAAQLQLRNLRAEQSSLRSLTLTPGQLAGRALEPTGPDAPRPVIYLAGGLLFGFLLGSVAAVALDRRDDGIHGVDDLERSAGVPVLATLQGDSFRRGSATRGFAAVDDVYGTEADAFRTLAAKLRGPATGRGARSIVLVCPGGRNARLAPANLAVTLARQGLDVALIAADGAMARTTELLAALARAGAESELRHRDGSRRVPAVDRVHLLSLGDELLLDATLRDPDALGLDAVMEKADIMVVDAVNLQLPSSTLTLGRLADAALVLGEERKSRHTDVRRAVRDLAQVGTPVVGATYVRRRRRFPVRWSVRRPKPVSQPTHAAARPRPALVRTPKAPVARALRPGPDEPDDDSQTHQTASR